jgi:hypothetical protein
MEHEDSNPGRASATLQHTVTGVRVHVQYLAQSSTLLMWATDPSGQSTAVRSVSLADMDADEFARSNVAGLVEVATWL